MSALLFRPRPEPDELLSSWLVRLAAANVQKLHPFTCSVFGSGRGHWYRDINQHVSTADLENLGARTLVGIERMRAMTLRAYEGTVFESARTNGQTAWVLPIAMVGRRVTTHGQQFCRTCLADSPPYFRRQWRLAFVVECLRHGTILEDCCGWCGNAISFHATEYGQDVLPGSRGLATCAHCFRDLRMAPRHLPGPPSAAMHQLQQQLAGVLEHGCSATLPGARNYGLLGLEGVHHLVRLLCSRQLAGRTRTQLALEAGLLDLGLPRCGRFETLRIGDRYLVLDMARRLLEEWPSAFVRLCREARVTASNVSDRPGELPYWLSSVARWDLSDGHYAPSEQERESVNNYLRATGQPASRNAVNKLLGVSHVSRSRASHRPVNAWNRRKHGPRFPVIVADFEQ